jgi:hypothetical protein
MAKWPVLAPNLCSLDISDVLTARGNQLALFADDIHIYATEKDEYRIVGKVQRGLTAVNLWSEHWNIMINKGSLKGSISRENLFFYMNYSSREETFTLQIV